MLLKLIISTVIALVVLSLFSGPMISAALALLAFSLLFYYNTKSNDSE